MPYKLGSLFDGSGGFPLSGSLCGIEPRWAAEVEPYPIAVTRTRFPNMRHLGDISKVSGADIEPVDIITFGSPCQDLSVAGKRAGLKHEANGDDETTRSGLFMEAVRIIKEMREATNGIYPRYALWENVPGAFSSNKGEDFRIVCEELIKVVEPSAVMPSVPQKGWAYADSYIGDGWSLAYRVFDAQYWGVPQRRRRINLVVDFRGECAREVLFEREGVRGYFETGRTPWQAAPADAEDRAAADDREGEGIKCYTPWDTQTRRCYGVDGVAPSLCAGAETSGQNQQSFCIPVGRDRGLDAVGFMRQLSGIEAQAEVSPTILAAAGESGNNKPCVAYTMKIRSGVDVDANGKGAGKGPLVQVDKSATLSTVQDQYLFAPVPPIAIIDNIGGQAEYGKVALVNATLRAGGQGAIAFAVEPQMYENHSQDTRYKGPLGVAQTVTATYGMGVNNQPFVVEPVAFDGANVTSPVNASNPQPGDPCHTLSTDSRNYLVEPVYCLQGNGIDRADTAGCNGKGVKEDICYTLNTIDRPAVAFCETYQDKVGSLCMSDYKGADNQYISDNKAIVENHGTSHYIVRRLTPTECARLQGFADRWGDIEKKDSFTPEEYEFWHEVRNTHAAINGKKVQEYTEAQMLTWYNKLQTDAAEYKMWGNGIALPPALYCMQGIVDVMNKADEDDWLL